MYAIIVIISSAHPLRVYHNLDGIFKVGRMEWESSFVTTKEETTKNILYIKHILNIIVITDKKTNYTNAFGKTALIWWYL